MTGAASSGRSTSRSPPFVVVGLTVALAIMGFYYWRLSAMNSDLTFQLDEQRALVRMELSKRINAEKRAETVMTNLKGCEDLVEKDKSIITEKESTQKSLADQVAALTDQVKGKEKTENQCRADVKKCQDDTSGVQQELQKLKENSAKRDQELEKLKSAAAQSPTCNCDKPVEDTVKSIESILEKNNNMQVIQTLRANGIKIGKEQAQPAVDNMYGDGNLLGNNFAPDLRLPNQHFGANGFQFQQGLGNVRDAQNARNNVQGYGQAVAQNEAQNNAQFGGQNNALLAGQNKPQVGAHMDNPVDAQGRNQKDSLNVGQNNAQIGAQNDDGKKYPQEGENDTANNGGVAQEVKDNVDKGNEDEAEKEDKKSPKETDPNTGGEAPAGGDDGQDGDVVGKVGMQHSLYHRLLSPADIDDGDMAYDYTEDDYNDDQKEIDETEGNADLKFKPGEGNDQNRKPEDSDDHYP